MQLQPGELSQHDALNYVTAGNATFTVRNKKSGNRFTFRARKPRQETPESTNVLFISVLTGAENDSDRSYSYIGFLRQYNGVWRFTYGKKSKIGQNAKSIIAFSVVFNQFLSLKKIHPDLEVWHMGRCGRCNHPLTDPESIRKGIGPICDGIRDVHYEQQINQHQLY